MLNTEFLQKVPVIKSQNIELSVPASSTLLLFKFQDQPFLRNRAILSIESFTANDMPLSPLGNILPSTANLKAATLNLYGSDPENLDAFGQWMQIPLVSTHRMVNGTDPYVFEKYQMVPRAITWEKSTISLTSALANGSALSFLITVTYSDFENLSESQMRNQS